MALELGEALQRSLGDSYRLLRELGGGGMSRVYLAEEAALGRQVVIKVLAPELAAGVNLERFRREIQVAAQLQHAFIVPLLASGVSDGLPWYSMPFVEGESLRARLDRTGELPVPQVIRVLRDVAEALAYAHEHSVVHRDIKPDNVLLTAQHALVTDFGVAKAVYASSGGAGTGLTSIGVALGTPAYMAPEQAVGDPATDSRADLYALGVLAYETLTGHPVFEGRAPAQLLAAHATQSPEPVARRRPAIPASLAKLVMQLLEKRAADRPQSAEVVVATLDAMVTPSQETGSPIASGSTPAVSAVSLTRALFVYSAAFASVVIAAWGARWALGLPDWVLPGTALVMAAGLPVVAITAWVHQHGIAATSAASLIPEGNDESRKSVSRFTNLARTHFTWKRTVWGGVIAVSAFVLAIVGFMTSRVLGIGPGATLRSSGALDARDWVLVADFDGPSNDTTLGTVVSEALNSDLAAAGVVRIVGANRRQQLLELMQRPATTRFDESVAREAAARGNVKAFLAGEVKRIGDGYLLSARILTTEGGDVIESFLETARDQSEFIPAIDRLSRSVRERIGQSFRSVRATPPLFAATTSSLEALRNYTNGVRAVRRSDYRTGMPMLERAVAQDSTFSSAYRRLAAYYFNLGEDRRASDAATKAYAYRARLPEAERLLVEETFYKLPTREWDMGKAIAAGEALLQIEPGTGTAANNLAQNYRSIRDYPRALQVQPPVPDSSIATNFSLNPVRSIFGAGMISEAKREATRLAIGRPDDRILRLGPVWVAMASHDFDSATVWLERYRRDFATDRQAQRLATSMAAEIAKVRGRVREAAREQSLGASLDSTFGSTFGLARSAVDREIDLIWLDVWFRESKDEAIKKLDAFVSSNSPRNAHPLEYPYPALIRSYAEARQPATARALLSQFDSAVKAVGLEKYFTATRHASAGDVLLSEGKPSEAIGEYRASDVGDCRVCALAPLGRSYDLANMPDSAITIFERYLATPDENRIQAPAGGPVRQPADAVYLAGIHKRLGELYEAKGEDKKAIDSYERFIALWKNADPELQPKVAEARRRVAALRTREKSRQ